MRWHPFQLNPEMPVDGLNRRLYRSAKFGSWEQSQRLDAQVAAAGKEFGHRVPPRFDEANTEHIQRTRAARGCAEGRLRDPEQSCRTTFPSYFIKGEDVGDPTTLLRIAREFGVSLLGQSKISTASPRKRGEGGLSAWRCPLALAEFLKLRSKGR